MPIRSSSKLRFFEVENRIEIVKRERAVIVEQVFKFWILNLSLFSLIMVFLTNYVYNYRLKNKKPQISRLL